jgi:DNA polymerase-3 subunit delta
MPSTVFVVCHKHKKADLRTKFGKALQGKKVVLFESKKLYENQVPDWISSYCKAKNLSVEPAAAALMAEYLGNDLAKIANELDKLALNLPAKTSINSAHVQEYVGISKDYNVFELQKAFALRDTAKIARIREHFAANIRKNPLIVTISSLFAYFSKVFMLHSLKGSPDAELVKALDLRSDWFLKEYKIAANNYSPAQTAHIERIRLALERHGHRHNKHRRRGVDERTVLENTALTFQYLQVNLPIKIFNYDTRYSPGSAAFWRTWHWPCERRGFRADLRGQPRNAHRTRTQRKINHHASCTH